MIRITKRRYPCEEVTQTYWAERYNYGRDEYGVAYKWRIWDEFGTTVFEGFDTYNCAVEYIESIP